VYISIGSKLLLDKVPLVGDTILAPLEYAHAWNTKEGGITVPLVSCLTGLESADNFCFYLQNRLIQTSQAGGQWYSDTPLFSIPWLLPCS
jgi:hypothetical protein